MVDFDGPVAASALESIFTFLRPCACSSEYSESFELSVEPVRHHTVSLALTASEVSQSSPFAARSRDLSSSSQEVTR